MVDFDDLKDKASVATPGPWCAQVKDGAIFTTWDTHGGWIALARMSDDCAYIASADPSTVLRLIDRLQQAETRRDEMLEALKLYEKAFDALFTQCLSNGIKDAWGKPINCSLLNEAHSVALGLVRS